jgi:hypothetical protein
MRTSITSLGGAARDNNAPHPAFPLTRPRLPRVTAGAAGLLRRSPPPLGRDRATVKRHRLPPAVLPQHLPLAGGNVPAGLHRRSFRELHVDHGAVFRCRVPILADFGHRFTPVISPRANLATAAAHKGWPERTMRIDLAPAEFRCRGRRRASGYQGRGPLACPTLARCSGPSWWGTRDRPYEPNGR